MPRKILFVCLGNICRSPTAEAVFCSLETGVKADSAGTSGWHINEPPYGPMQQSAKARGYDMSNLRARGFVAEDFDRFDLIIGMDDKNLGDIEALRPAGNATPVRLFTDYAPDAGMDHVPDPYYTRDFDGTLDLIELAAEGLAKELATL
jgi:protein-tyrosine phosphatase